MRALNIHGVGDVRLDPKERPVVGPRDAVVLVRACGICGSDLCYVRWGGINRAEDGVTPLGHEAAGEILEVGAEVQGLVVGQRVAVNPMATPSFIGSGGPEGAFAEQVLIREAALGVNLVPIDDEISFEIAAMAEPLSVALHAVNRLEAKAGEKIVVFGCGPIGIGMILWLVERGVTEVIAIDLSDNRLAVAESLGAFATINAGRVNAANRIRELHGSHVYYGRDVANTDGYLDAAGAPNIVNDVIDLAKFHSRLVMTAVRAEPTGVNLGGMLTSELTITTSLGYPTEFAGVVAALPRLREKLLPLITHRYVFDDVLQGFETAARHDSIKVMVEFPVAVG